jgi:hypothetical protein
VWSAEGPLEFLSRLRNRCETSGGSPFGAEAPVVQLAVRLAMYAAELCSDASSTTSSLYLLVE